MADQDDIPEGWEGPRRPPEDQRWHREDPGPVSFEMTTSWMYSDPRRDKFETILGNKRPWAFSRGGEVTRSDVPSSYSHEQSAASHLWRAIEKFGDDVDLIITVQRKPHEH